MTLETGTSLHNGLKPNQLTPPDEIVPGHKITSARSFPNGNFFNGNQFLSLPIRIMEIYGHNRIELKLLEWISCQK